LHRLGARIDELHNCYLTNELKALIADTIQDPLSLPVIEIQQGLEIAQRVEVSLNTLSTLEKDVYELLKWLQSAFNRGDMSEDHAFWCDDKRREFTSLISDIENAHTIDLLETLIKEAEGIRDSLATVRGRGASKEESEPAKRTLREQIDEALAVLGLSRNSGLTWRHVITQRNAFWRNHSTDVPENRKTPEQYRKNTEILQKINLAFDFLQLYKDKLIDVTV
jgi:hypothetical protein